MKKEKSVFRDAVAKFIRKERKWHSNKEIRPLVVAFSDGWQALADEMDKVNEKYCKHVNAHEVGNGEYTATMKCNDCGKTWREEIPE